MDAENSFVESAHLEDVVEVLEDLSAQLKELCGEMLKQNSISIITLLAQQSPLLEAHGHGLMDLLQAQDLQIESVLRFMQKIFQPKLPSPCRQATSWTGLNSGF